MSRLPALVASLMLPLPLWAETCPVAADLTTGGIAFEVDQGDVEVFWQKRPGLIESHYAYGGDMANATRAMLAHGIYVLELTDLENGKVVAGSRSAYSFPMLGCQSCRSRTTEPLRTAAGRGRWPTITTATSAPRLRSTARSQRSRNPMAPAAIR